MALGAMLIYGVATFPGSERTFYFICLGFWTFFAVRAWRAVRWRRNGLEVVQLSREGLELRMDHGTIKGRTTLLPLSTLGEAVVPEPNPRSFLGVDGTAILGGRRRPHPPFGERQNLRVWQATRPS